MKASHGVLILFVLLVVVVGGYFYLGYTGRITNHEPQGSTIIAFGDELVTAEDVPADLQWTSLLEKRFGVTIEKAGQNEVTTDRAVIRVKNDVLSKDPKVVILLIGRHDLEQNIELEQSIENMRQIISKLHTEGVAVCLVGVKRLKGQGRYNDALADLAADMQCAFVGNILDGIASDMTLMLPNGFVPNSRGQEIMAKRIGNKLESKIPSVFKD
ncbi:MAG: GDSL-type esterase/lipase family protein [Candidatus Sumerlaeia bacterium]